MQQRVRCQHRGNFIPSSSGQLPVPVALNALSPTLFRNTIHHGAKNVNNFFIILPQPVSGQEFFPFPTGFFLQQVV